MGTYRMYTDAQGKARWEALKKSLLHQAFSGKL